TRRSRLDRSAADESCALASSGEKGEPAVIQGVSPTPPRRGRRSRGRRSGSRSHDAGRALTQDAEIPQTSGASFINTQFVRLPIVKSGAYTLGGRRRKARRSVLDTTTLS